MTLLKLNHADYIIDFEYKSNQGHNVLSRLMNNCAKMVSVESDTITLVLISHSLVFST